MLDSVSHSVYLFQKQSHFSQQNCTTKDSQEKYKGRTAQLYREKLHGLAVKAQRNYGTKVNYKSKTDGCLIVEKLEYIKNRINTSQFEEIIFLKCK